ncbi:MAG: ubiquinol-cytochrome C chaperone family protein [Dongiaceae bacterium]
MGPFSRIFKRDPAVERAQRLYRGIVEQARRREFYAMLGVPDSLDGRFEMVALHVFLILHRLKQAGPQGDAALLGQALCDAMFADMDASLREMGAGDLGVAGRVKQMASGFMGRLAAYSDGLAAGPAALIQALRRNVYGTTEVDYLAIEMMSGYVTRSTEILAGQSIESIGAGKPEFAPLTTNLGPTAMH